MLVGNKVDLTPAAVSPSEHNMGVANAVRKLLTLFLIVSRHMSRCVLYIVQQRVSAVLKISIHWKQTFV